MAGIDVAPGVDDGDHGLAGIIGARIAHLRTARAMAERAQVVDAVPAMRAQFFGFLARVMAMSDRGCATGSGGGTTTAGSNGSAPALAVGPRSSIHYTQAARAPPVDEMVAMRRHGAGAPSLAHGSSRAIWRRGRAPASVASRCRGESTPPPAAPFRIEFFWRSPCTVWRGASRLAALTRRRLPSRPRTGVAEHRARGMTRRTRTRRPPRSGECARALLPVDRQGAGRAPCPTRAAARPSARSAKARAS